MMVVNLSVTIIGNTLAHFLGACRGFPTAFQIHHRPEQPLPRPIPALKKMQLISTAALLAGAIAMIAATSMQSPAEMHQVTTNGNPIGEHRVHSSYPLPENPNEPVVPPVADGPAQLERDQTAPKKAFFLSTLHFPTRTGGREGRPNRPGEEVHTPLDRVLQLP
jgi:hypothetical protein